MKLVDLMGNGVESDVPSPEQLRDAYDGLGPDAGVPFEFFVTSCRGEGITVAELMEDGFMAERASVWEEAFNDTDWS